MGSNKLPLPIKKYDWKIFEKNNLTTSLNVFYAKKEKIYPTYVSKKNSNREKQIVLLMISNSITSGITSNVIKNINPNFFA